MEITYGLLRRFEKTHSYFTVFKEFLSNITILPFDQKAAVECSMMRKVLESKGTPIGAYDILIASIAKAEDLILVTSNINEFTRIDNLKIENWRI
jgi:tRNA(fMet)-specific endonuclease VapC